MTSAVQIEGGVWQRGDEGYEAVRQAAVWEHRKPNRYPDMIVRVANEQDVAAAVRYAREHGLKVKARGGGHSNTGSAVRDGILIDFTDFHQITFDAEAMTATVTPSVLGTELNQVLAEHGLFFPSGHCPEVGLGGFLLQGGFGWNGRTLGMACSSVRAIDVVTADGELIHADDTTNADYMWAARGAGSGYFGVVTRFYLGLQPMPESMLLSIYVYPMDAFADVVPWCLEAVRQLPRFVEPFLFGMQPPEADEPLVFVFAAAYADSEQEGRDALAVFESCPAIDRALERRFATPTSFPELYGFMESGARPGRYAVDGMWTHEPPAVIAPEIHELFTSIPTSKCAVFVMPWDDADVPNGAFSLQAPLYISATAVWDDEEDDERCLGLGDRADAAARAALGGHPARRREPRQPHRHIHGTRKSRAARAAAVQVRPVRGLPQLPAGRWLARAGRPGGRGRHDRQAVGAGRRAAASRPGRVTILELAAPATIRYGALRTAYHQSRE
jgi:hypothetical protein